MRQHRPYAESLVISSRSEEEMNSYVNAAVAIDRSQQLVADAAEFRRSRINRKTKAVRRRFHR
jgi:hypothetical protein